jgi:hypothetical protein
MAQTRAFKSAASAATGLLTVAAAALALAGCGGSSDHNAPAASSANGSAPAASVEASAGQSSGSVIAGTSGSHSKSSRGLGSGSASGSGSGSASGGAASAGGSKAKSGAKSQLRAVDIVSKPTSHKARGGPDEPQLPQTKGPNPCRLVSQSEASSILGVSVQQSEAPLGPTCIMKVGQQKQVITLAVEAVSVKTQVKNMHEVQTATVGGHQTYCGKLGTSQFYLSLGGGKAIAVTAPCPVARALAATALTHLKA